jgi:hypothetical protein
MMRKLRKYLFMKFIKMKNLRQTPMYLKFLNNKLFRIMNILINNIRVKMTKIRVIGLKIHKIKGCLINFSKIIK